MEIKPLKTIDSPNAKIEIYDDYVKKILKKKTSKEKLARFKVECKALDSLKVSGITNIVNVTQIKDSDNPPWYEMKRYAGDSNSLLNETKGNVVFVARLILPIIQTLKLLSELKSPIYHRDIKPENLLFEKTADNIKLILADFGCAFFRDSEDERITSDYRSVGARAFLAPEYHHGRVENVNEKGDVFSIGKLLWYYVNGVDCEVFPYTLWFPSEYDLQKRQPTIIGVAKLVSIIASCTHHDPLKRPNYESLLISLQSLIKDPEITSIESRKLKAKIFEQHSSLENLQRQAMVETLLNVFISDVKEAFEEIQKEFGDIGIIKNICNGNLYQRGRDQTIKEVVNQQYDSAIWVFQGNNIRIFSIYCPVTFSSSDSLPSLKYPFIKIDIRTSSNTGSIFSRQIIWFYDLESVIKQKMDNETKHHNAALLTKELIKCLDNYFE